MVVRHSIPRMACANAHHTTQPRPQRSTQQGWQRLQHRGADVVNVYGEPGAADGGAGRLVSRSDASGTVSYLYGKLGETVGVSRTITRWSGSPVSSTMRTEWDYLGRLQEVRYPDGEVLLYGYDEGGQIASATGFHDGYTEVGGLDHWSSEHWWWSQDRGQHWNRGRGWGWYSSLRSRDWNSWWQAHPSHGSESPHHHRRHPTLFTLTEYVKDIGYDAFGQRVALDLGNGVSTSYSYDADRRWLQAISTRTADATSLQGIQYSFDLVGNILAVGNNATAFGKGYTSSASYAYDELDQLVQASATLSKAVEGNTKWRGEGWHTAQSSTYTQAFAFDALGNLTRKTSAESGAPPSPPRASLTYDLTYQYYEGKAHQAERIGSFWYRYDANGNLLEERRWGQEPLASGRQASFTGAPGYGEAGTGYLERLYQWDEENRLVASSEQGGLDRVLPLRGRRPAGTESLASRGDAVLRLDVDGHGRLPQRLAVEQAHLRGLHADGHPPGLRRTGNGPGLPPGEHLLLPQRPPGQRAAGDRLPGQGVRAHGVHGVWRAVGGARAAGAGGGAVSVYGQRAGPGDWVVLLRGTVLKPAHE